MIKLTYAEAKPLIQEADILLFRGEAWSSQLIKWGNRGQYSHVGMCSKWNGHIECLEFRGNTGGRAVNLETQVNLYPGAIDVYTLSDKVQSFEYKDGKVEIKWKDIDRKAITSVMRKIMGEPYSWWRIWDLMKYNLPILRWFKRYRGDDKTNDISKIEKVCSTSTAASVRIGYTDLVKDLSDMDVMPSDVSRSPLLHYLFTLMPSEVD